MAETSKRIVNLQTVRRLPIYLNMLKRLSREEVPYISTTELIKHLKFEPMLVRKDLASLGIAGRQRLGYRPQELIAAIEEYLGWNKGDEAFLVGAGGLGGALLGYKKFEEHGFKIVAAFDSDERKVGRSLHGIEVLPISKLANLAARMGIRLAVLTVPPENAQSVAELLVASGVIGIWNFTSEELHVPAHVVCHNENLTGGLALFTYKLRVLAAKEADDAPIKSSPIVWCH